MAAEETITAPPAEESTASKKNVAPQENVSQETIDASSGFVGQWQTLVSTTNWDKGQIICAWRDELKKSGAPVSQYSDEAWSQIVGEVTGQHVGRLRRTYERFGQAAKDYDGLYWSHFQTALDWEDAEMWLEGALQNKWSVSQMRAQRWETVGDGAKPEERPAETAEALPSAPAPIGDDAEAVDAEIRDASDDDSDDSEERAESGEPQSLDAPAAERREPVRPMKDLAELPDDLAEAFEQFKLAILTHKMTGWSEISCDDVLASLSALEKLALAPSE